MAESGYPGVESDFWFAVFAPAGTPDTAIDALNRSFRAAMKNPGVTGKPDELALDIVTGTPVQLSALIRDDAQRPGAVVRDAGAKAG